MFKKFYSLVLVLLTATFIISCRDNENIEPEIFPSALTESYPLALATDWQDLHLQLIKTTPGFAPPIAARSLAYANLALYEATVYGTENKSLAGAISNLSSLPKPDLTQEYNWGIAANTASYTILNNLFSSTSTGNQLSIAQLQLKYKELLSQGEDSLVIKRSRVFGEEIANAIWEASKKDKGHEAYLNPFPNYTIPVGIGFWRPFGNQKALLPSWGNNTQLVADNTTVEPHDPISFSYKAGSGFFNEAKEVYTIGKSLTAEQKAIANFWADGGGTITPPGHHMNIATIVLKDKEATLAQAAETYAKMGLALNDAFITCWRCKYKYNLIRPVTYIREAIDKDWMPYLATPPFPEYISGHSTGAGAAAEILANQFGENTSFLDNTYHNVYPDRPFANFTTYANESSNSRIYGGIHYRKGCVEGVNTGREIARNVLALPFKE